jgi:hypothetical protein
MFVISLLCKGKILKTAIRGTANESVNLAHSWYESHSKECEMDGYISIDQQVKGQSANIRFAEINFSESTDQAKLYLHTKNDLPVFSSRYTEITKTFLINFLEYALLRLTEYMRDKHKNGRND